MSPSGPRDVSIDSQGTPTVRSHIIDMHVIQGHILEDWIDLVIPAPMYDKFVIEKGGCMLGSLQWRSPLGSHFLSNELDLYLVYSFEVTILLRYEAKI